MDIFLKIINETAKTPAWVYLIAVPALILCLAVLFTLVGGRKLYPALAAFLCAAGGCLIACNGETAATLVYCFAVAGESALLSLLFFLPRPRKRDKKKSKADELYEKFREELTEKPFKAEKERPPKVCCFEEPPAGDTVTLEESGMRLNHADTLIERLRTVKLSAGDRLELDALARSLDLYRGKPLTEEEIRSLNDCLATVLKLTAKYKL